MQPVATIDRRGPAATERGANLPPELREFIDRAVVPALLERFLAEMRQDGPQDLYLHRETDWTGLECAAWQKNR